MTPAIISHVGPQGSPLALIPPGTPSPELVLDPLIDRFDLLFLFRKFWKRLLIAPVLGGALALILALISQPLFESSAVILVDAAFDEIVQFETVQNTRDSGLASIKSLEIALLSDTVMLRVLDRLKLREEDGFLPKSLSPQAGVSDAEVLKYLRAKRFRSVLRPETRLIEISVLDPKPERAQRIARAFTTEFETFLAEQRRTEANQARSGLEEQARQAREDALKSEDRLMAFRRGHPDIPVEQDHNLYAVRLSQFGDELTVATKTRMQLESQVEAMDEIDPQKSPMDVIEVAQYKDMPHVSGLLTALSDSRARFSIAGGQFTEKHPAYRSAEAEVLRNETELRQLAADIKSAVHANYLSAKSREAILTKELAIVQKGFVEMKSLSTQFRALQTQSERDWLAHQALQNKISESTVSTEFDGNIATVVSEPMIAFKKAKPRTLFYLIVGGAIGSLFSAGALGVAILVGLPFSSRQQLEQRLGLPVIADWSDSTKADLSSSSTALLQFLGGNRDKTIQIYAPEMNGVGQSVAARVAHTAAANGRRTLLMLIKPGRNDLKIQPTEVRNLYRIEVTPDVVRHNSRFPDGLRQLKNEFDNIFVEAGGAGDQEMIDFLSSLTDQDVIVVGRDRTRKQQVEEQVIRLSKPGAAPVAFIMVDPASPPNPFFS